MPADLPTLPSTGVTVRRVLLVGAAARPGLESLGNYEAGVVAAAALNGTEFSRAGAPWWRPGPAWFADAAGRFRGEPRLAPASAAGHDLVHIVEHSLAHHAPAFAGHPVVITVHDLLPLSLLTYASSAPSRRWTHWLLRQPLAQIPRYPIIAVSEATRASLLEHGLVRDAERVHVVPPTIDGRFVPVADAAERLRAAGVLLPPGPLVLSIGTARRYKNLPLLLAAVARPELAGARVVRVGAALTPDLRRLAGRLGLADRVVELGSLGSREVATLYSACDVLAQPSLGEGFGLPVAEAMACGTPVVASDGGALPEVVGDAGVVVPLDGDPAYGSPGAVDRFAEALARVLGDRGLATDLKRRGLARAQSFRPEAIAPRIARAYEAAAAVR